MLAFVLLLSLIPLCFSQALPVSTINSDFAGTIVSPLYTSPVTGTLRYDSRAPTAKQYGHLVITALQFESTNYAFSDDKTYVTTYVINAGGQCTNTTVRVADPAWPKCTGWIESAGKKTQTCTLTVGGVATQIDDVLSFAPDGLLTGIKSTETASGSATVIDYTFTKPTAAPPDASSFVLPAACGKGGDSVHIKRSLGPFRLF